MSIIREDRVHLTTIEDTDLPALVSGRRTALVTLDDAGEPGAPRSPGELVYLRARSGQVCAAARIERIERFENLTAHDLRLLRESYGSRTVGDGSVWTQQPSARGATIVWLGEIRPVVDAAAIPGELMGLSRSHWRTLDLAPASIGRAA